MVVQDAVLLPAGLAVLRSDGLLCGLSDVDGRPAWRHALGALEHPQLLAGSDWLCVLHSVGGKARAVVVDLRKPADAPKGIDVSNGGRAEPLGAWICNWGLVLAWNDHWASHPLSEPEALREAHLYPTGVRVTRAKLTFGWPPDKYDLDHSQLYFAGDDGAIYAAAVQGVDAHTIGAISQRQMKTCAALEFQRDALLLSGPKAAFRIDLREETAGRIQAFESRGPIGLESVDARQMLGFARIEGDEPNRKLWFLIDFADTSSPNNRIRPLVTGLDVRSVVWRERSLILVGPNEIQCFARE